MMRALLWLLCCLPVLAHGQLVPEVGIGVTQFGRAIDGRWVQAPFPHTTEMRSGSSSVGFRWTTGRQIGPFDNLYVRAGYEYQGRASSNAEATASDANYAACAAGKEPCWPMSHWIGHGDVQGLYVSLLPERMVDGIGLHLELGAYLYRPRWEVTIPDWIGSRADTPHLVHVVHTPKWQISPTLGFGMRRGAWAVAYTIRRISADGDDYPAIYDRACHNLSIRLTF